MKVEDRYLGFYSLSETQAKDGFLGALLITDQFGRPLEFRVTHPVKPTAIQRPLYGAALKPFIGVELCAKQLVRQLKRNMDLLVVSDEFLVDVREFIPCPVIHIQRAGDAIEVKTEGVSGPGWVKRQISSTSGRYQPIIIRTTSDHEDDIERARASVEDAFSHMDLLEPFERITKALELLAREDSRFA